MKVRWKVPIKIFSVVLFTLFFCEFLIYYLVIGQCSWPSFQDGSVEGQNESLIKVMFLADLHLLGPYRGHWFDKLRREWQMHRAFQSAVTLYQPEYIFILGDLFDEGHWTNKIQFEQYVARFLSLFDVPDRTEIYVVPGNHDIGFHYALRPSLLEHFEKVFNISSVKFLDIKTNYFVLINSMALEGDGCFLCSETEKKLKSISVMLNCAKKNKKCSMQRNLKAYSRPIILQHFPMYRKSDSLCSEIDEAPPDIKDSLFREKFDCLSQQASDMIYDKLNPRLIINGHVHHGCHVVHKEDIHEYTLPSFSWRNKNDPTFMLAKITPNNFVLRKCELPKETTVIFLYVFVVVACASWIMFCTFCKKMKLL